MRSFCFVKFTLIGDCARFHTTSTVLTQVRKRTNKNAKEELSKVKCGRI